MKWLGIDLEVNRKNEGKGIWNVGIALFEGRKCLDYYNVFIEEFWSENPHDGYGATYFKSRSTVDKARRPVWVKTAKDADNLISTIIQGWGFHRSFGYNSNVFDLGKMEGVLPKTLKQILSKPHVDVMPMVAEHLLTRKSYKAYWEAQVKMGNTHEGNADYCKFGAELVLNYIASLRLPEWNWKKEEHIGCEDLIDFEYPILHYFMRILKKKVNVSPAKPRKWEV